jgi:para-aminobenzoate synthetase component 1
MSQVIETPRTEPCVEPLAGLTPWEVCQRLADHRHLLFLDSAQSPSPPGPLPRGVEGRNLGRYSFVSADPVQVLTSHHGWISVNGKFVTVADPLTMLAHHLADFALEPIAELPPFQGGAAGLFSYDLCHHIEVLPRPLYNDFSIPDLAVGIYDWVIAFDHQTEQSWLISTGYPEADPHRRWQRAKYRGEQVKRLLDQRPPSPKDSKCNRIPIETPQFPVDGLPGITSNFDRNRYLQTVARAIEYTHAGDCFQVNIAQRLLMPARGTPLELYEKLRTRNSAPFAGYFDLGDHAIVSASPERFMCVRDGEVETRPIKGTRPRGKTLADDQRLAQELLTSGKDHAENVMIVDLMRNDLGRVCKYGSVRVEALCRLESYPFVHHLVSEVRGRLRSGLGPTDLLRASFPGGSVTGAPKIRAMEIIAELEQTARGAYCGCLGYVGFDGSMDTNLLIRTFVFGKGWLHFSVGGGIVADSTPDKEYAETWHKAEGMLRALRD